jgi:hypothetical protein
MLELDLWRTCLTNYRRDWTRPRNSPLCDAKKPRKTARQRPSVSKADGAERLFAPGTSFLQNGASAVAPQSGEGARQPHKPKVSPTTPSHRPIAQEAGPHHRTASRLFSACLAPRASQPRELARNTVQVVGWWLRIDGGSRGGRGPEAPRWAVLFLPAGGFDYGERT